MLVGMRKKWEEKKKKRERRRKTREGVREKRWIKDGTDNEGKIRRW